MSQATEDKVTAIVASAAFDFAKAATVYLRDEDRYVHIAEGSSGSLSAVFGDAAAWDQAPDADLVVSMDADTLDDVLDGNITGIMGLWGKADINKGKMPYAGKLIEAIGHARADLGL